MKFVKLTDLAGSPTYVRSDLVAGVSVAGLDRHGHVIPGTLVTTTHDKEFVLKVSETPDAVIAAVLAAGV